MPDPHHLCRRILELLQTAETPLSAREIAAALNHTDGPTVEKEDVNRCLYSERLKNLVVQDSSYRWSIKSTAPLAMEPAPAAASQEQPRSELWARFARLVSYYIDCIHEDEGTAARFFLGDEGQKFLALPLATEWSLSEQTSLRLDVTGPSSRFAAELRQRRATATLFYGYPLYVHWIPRSKKGWTGGFAVPVFLQSVDFEIRGTELDATLVHEWPRLNSEFIRSIRFSSEEKKHFLDELGMLDPEAEPPDDGLADIVRRMVRHREWVESVERLEPEKLMDDPPIPEIARGGLYNRAILVIGDRPPYTKGLEYELPKLRDDATDEDLERSALRFFFAGEATRQPESEATDDVPPLVEVVPLNDEQRAAVRSAFEKSMTVVTGPPGTGKSQVVLSVLANAYVRRQRVLFTSRNNKAVNVVEARLNGLSRHPLMVRTGRRSGQRDLRAELLKFLTQVLSVSVTQEDRLAEEEARRAVQHLQNRREEVWTRLESVRHLRNEVDRLDKELLTIRKALPSQAWKAFWSLPAIPPNCDPAQAIDVLETHLERRSGLFSRIGLLLRRRKDFAVVRSLAQSLRAHPALFGPQPETDLSVHQLRSWWRYLQEVRRRLRALEVVLAYRRMYSKLKSSPTPDVFARQIALVETNLWDWGSRFIAAHGSLLPDRVNAEIRRALGQFRATIERLAHDQVGGRVYGKLMGEQERLFTKITEVLPVWCVTNLAASGSLPFESSVFDLLVIDEASQCDIPSALPLLYRARRVMIIGDPQQLRHISTIERHRDQQLQNKHGLTSVEDQPYSFSTNSLFDLAATCIGDLSVVSLREHFRSHVDIVAFSNEQWYRNTLVVCTDYRQLHGYSRGAPGIRWTQVRGSVNRPGGGGALNVQEAAAVVEELQSLLVDRQFPGSVGVVTPFRAQANRIRELVNERLDFSIITQSELIVDTAHGFQGDERDVILFSPCASDVMPRGARHFLSSTGNLFNVAITRARTLLHVVGDRDACASCGIRHVEEFARYVAQLENRTHESSERRGELADPRIGYWEMPFYEALVAAGLRPIPQYREHQYILDLAIKEGELWLDIEIDGELYHKEWDGTRSRRDVIRDLRLTALGWRVKRFWVYQIRDEMDACVREIIELVNAHRS